MKTVDCLFVVKHMETILRGDDELYAITALPEGGTLASFLAQQQHPGLPEEVVSRLWSQILLGLAYLHGKRLLHRDVHPANIFLSRGNTAILGDLGLAKIFFGDQAVASSYTAPEVVEIQPSSSSSDVWAAGCVAFEMCALRRAFEASTLSALCAKILQCRVPSLPTRYSLLMRHVIGRCFRRSPSQRPGAAELLRMPPLREAVLKLTATEAGKAMPSLQPLQGSSPPPAHRRGQPDPRATSPRLTSTRAVSPRGASSTLRAQSPRQASTGSSEPTGRRSGSPGHVSHAKDSKSRSTSPPKPGSTLPKARSVSPPKALDVSPPRRQAQPRQGRQEQRKGLAARSSSAAILPNSTLGAKSPGPALPRTTSLQRLSETPRQGRRPGSPQGSAPRVWRGRTTNRPGSPSNPGPCLTFAEKPTPVLELGPSDPLQDSGELTLAGLRACQAPTKHSEKSDVDKTAPSQMAGPSDKAHLASGSWPGSEPVLAACAKEGSEWEALNARDDSGTSDGLEAGPDHLLLRSPSEPLMLRCEHHLRDWGLGASGLGRRPSGRLPVLGADGTTWLPERGPSLHCSDSGLTLLSHSDLLHSEITEDSLALSITTNATLSAAASAPVLPFTSACGEVSRSSSRFELLEGQPFCGALSKSSTGSSMWDLGRHGQSRARFELLEAAPENSEAFDTSVTSVPRSAPTRGTGIRRGGSSRFELLRPSDFDELGEHSAREGQPALPELAAGFDPCSEVPAQAPARCASGAWTQPGSQQTLISTEFSKCTSTSQSLGQQGQSLATSTAPGRERFRLIAVAASAS